MSATAGPFARARPVVPAESEGHRLDFGRYVGWLLRDLVHEDPDYLRWLSRHSSGIRFRGEIQQLLPTEGWETNRVPVQRGGRS